MAAIDDFCPRYHHAVELIGRRWTGAILRAILAGRRRYADIRGAIPALSDTMLSERLHELEAEGIVERRVLPETPVRVEYHPTAKGKALESVVAALSTWADAWLDPDQHPVAEPKRRGRGSPS